MINILLSPVYLTRSLSMSRTGDVVRLNGAVCDFGRLAEGSSLPASAIQSEWFDGQVDRVEGNLHLRIRLPHGPNAPEETRFPVPIVVSVDGLIALPPYEHGHVADSQGQDIPEILIDWSKVITVEMKSKQAAVALLEQVHAEIDSLRKIADSSILPLQDAVDLESATEAEAALLNNWKRYRVALNRLPEQPGYPAEIDWPAPPT
nr:tail fiber assembly protein [Pseudomonas mosselii]